MNRRLLLRSALYSATAATALVACGRLKKTGLVDTAIAQAPTVQPPAAAAPPLQGQPSLKRRAAAKGLLYGAAAQPQILTAEPDFANSFARECAILVSENQLKWEALRPTPTQFNFAGGDALLAFAQQHQMLFRGHTLVWHNALPGWFRETLTRSNARHFLQEHIATVVGRYAGKVHSWDVVNEAIAPEENRPHGVRNTPWLELLGADYIQLAFQMAHQADPQALLVYNDYGLDYDTVQDASKRAAVLRLLERLKSANVPIHALGMQAHLWGSETRFSPEKLGQFLQQVADLDLQIFITELDVADVELPANVAERDRLVADHYRRYLDIVLAQPAVTAVLTWGLSDRHTWLTSFQPRPDGLPVRPLPLDQQLRRKPAWEAIAAAFDATSVRQLLSI